MTDAINANNRVKTPGLPADNRGKAAANPASSNATQGANASAVVELSSDQLLQQMKDLPAVDNSRVEAIKTALANGEYQPDPELIASKFAEIEKLLP